MNSNPLDLMNYFSWANKIFRYKKSVGDLFYRFTLYHRDREDFVYREQVGDAFTDRFLSWPFVETTVDATKKVFT